MPIFVPTVSPLPKAVNNMSITLLYALIYRMFHVKHNDMRHGLYVHVPFCISRCAYCSFCSSVDLTLADAFLDALQREAANAPHDMRAPSTLYVGGGSPSVLGPDRLLRMVHTLHQFFSLDTLDEFTVECNPDDITPALAHTLSSLGVSRVSMGAQSFSDNMLRLMHRRHNSTQVAYAVTLLRDAGILDISLDIMYGLPRAEGYSFNHDLSSLLLLQPTHLSAYALSYDAGTPFHSLASRGLIDTLQDDETASQYEALILAAQKAGYEHYEISNFALPGHRALHNSSYWQRTPYLGLGPAASSFLIAHDGSQHRRTNTTDIAAYCLSPVTPSPSLVEQLSPAEVAEEIVMLRLRTSDGLRHSDMEQLASLAPDVHHNVRKALEQGSLSLNADGGIALRESDWFISDNIILSLL